MAATLAATDFWAFRAHIEVWLLVAGLVGLYVYAVKVVGPKAVAPGQPVVTRAQALWFAGGVVVLWASSDWPVHDVGEQYLYSVHMSQHLLLTLVMPPMLLLGTPEWLARLVIGDGAVKVWVRRFCHPVVAGVAANMMTLVIHWPAVVNRSVSNGGLHYGMHLALVLTNLAMWMCICGPIKEWRISLPGQMVYLFLMSVVPTVPGAWLTFAEGAVYKAYDIPARMFDISVTQDQQAAGLIMKLIGGSYLWAIITVKFFQWASRHEKAHEAGTLVSERDVLTWDEVQAEFDRLGPAPADKA